MLANVRFGTVTNRETWIDRVEIRDDSGPLDLSGADCQLEVQYQPNGGRALSAKTGDGVLTATSEGLIQWRFDAAQMKSLAPGLYNIGLIYTLDGITTQVLTGVIQIDDGFLS
ncbi:MAG: hypothetical protein ACRDDO_06100 [Plesiomonas shigelloides]